MSVLLGMPAQYEMLVSHSPPVFSHSPPTSFLSEYAANNRLYDPTRSLFRSAHHLSSVRAAPRQPPLQPVPVPRRKMPNAPIRSCLAVRLSTDRSDAVDDATAADDDDDDDDDETSSADNSTEDDDDRSERSAKPKRRIVVVARKPTRPKKSVVFADQRGYALTEVRIMREPSGVPPMWSLEFLAHVTQGMVSPVPTEQWTVSFRQPASDYMDFRNTLDSKNVSLENVIVKENDSCVVGTVKVRNLHFQKEVIVRTSSDGWKTQEDTFCTYSTIGGSSGAYVLYDTFSFKLTLPPVSRKLEFCVCFRCDGKDYWDNNNNENYIIVKRSTNNGGLSDSANPANGGKISESSSAPISIPNQRRSPYATNDSKVAENPWTEFASWNYESAGPYW